MAETTLNGDGGMAHESSAVSIDTKSLSTQKVIQVKIDNPFMSNGRQLEKTDVLCIVQY